MTPVSRPKSLAVTFFTACFVALVLTIPRAFAQTETVETNDYEHDRFVTEPKDIFRDFGGFVLSFDSADDEDGDGSPDRWGIPHWVAHEIRNYDPPGTDACLETGGRPSRWFTESNLFNSRLAPSDASYASRGGWRSNHPNWFDRGHLAMKFLLERIKQPIGDNGSVWSPAAWNSHITLNAVPQRHKFNAGIWKDLEDLSGAWAQETGRVWVVAGPVILDGAPAAYIGDEGEIPVAIPDALFKIVARGGDNNTPPEVLAFLYPQIGPGYDSKRGTYPHERYLVSVDRIEELTGLDFFTVYDSRTQAEIESSPAPSVWTRPARASFIRACR